MAKFYYGGGKCTIEGSDIRGVEIRYRGAITIQKTCGESFALIENNNGIIIFPIGEGTLNKLFTYTGEFRVTSIIVADNNAEKVSTTIHKVMDYSELLTSNAEDLTTKSEDLKATYTFTKKVSKTSSSQRTMSNQNTSQHDGILYLEDGTEYEGYFHVHLKDSSAMTGKNHTKDSQDLFYKQIRRGRLIDKLVPTRNPSHIPPANRLEPKTNKKHLRRPRINKKGGVGRGGGY